MASKRLIKPEIYTNEDLNEAENKTGFPFRTLFAGILALSNRDGVFQWKPRSMALKICPAQYGLPFDFVLLVLKYFKMVTHYKIKAKDSSERDREYGLIPGFSEHQSAAHKEAASESRPLPDEGEFIPVTEDEQKLVESVLNYEEDIFFLTLKHFRERFECSKKRLFGETVEVKKTEADPLNNFGEKGATPFRKGYDPLNNFEKRGGPLSEKSRLNKDKLIEVNINEVNRNELNIYGSVHKNSDEKNFDVKPQRVSATNSENTLPEKTSPQKNPPKEILQNKPVQQNTVTEHSSLINKTHPDEMEVTGGVDRKSGVMENAVQENASVETNGSSGSDGEITTRERKTVSDPPDNIPKKNMESRAKLARITREKKYSGEFEVVWQNYPKRAGSNPKNKAYRQYMARREEGELHEDLLRGTLRYAAYCQHTGKLKTEYIQQAATFFGKNKGYLESWDPPEEQQDFAQLSAVDQVRVAHGEAPLGMNTWPTGGPVYDIDDTETYDEPCDDGYEEPDEGPECDTGGYELAMEVHGGPLREQVDQKLRQTGRWPLVSGIGGEERIRPAVGFAKTGTEERLVCTYGSGIFGPV